MAKKKDSTTIKSITIPYFEGVNAIVASHLAKKEEFIHAENARSRTIGSIEKRQGYRRLGDVIIATANYGIFFFDNTGNNGFYRISTVSATTSIYYLSAAPAWTALTGNGAGLTASQADITFAEGNCYIVNGNDSNRYIGPGGTAVYTSDDLGDSTTQFDITNPAGDTYRYTYDTTGTDPAITTNINTNDIVHVTGSNMAAANRGSFPVTGVSTNYFEVTNASGTAENNKTLGTGVLRVLNNLTNSPVANRINYYKDRLYLADYTVGSTSFPNSIMMSSEPVGIVALVDGDHATSQTTINVTDTKYIYANDVLDVYRGSTRIQSLIVTAKTEDTITVDTTANAFNSADELWVAGTYGAKKVFRWADNSAGGINVKQYDTFKLDGGQNDSIRLLDNVGDSMVIANKFNFGCWNGSRLDKLDGGIGCVSYNGSTKLQGVLYFLGYKGIYATRGIPGEIPQLISVKVQPYFDGATKANLEIGAMGIKGESVFCAVGDVSLYHPDGSDDKTLSDTVIERDVRKDNWYIHTGLKVTEFATYSSTSDADRLEFASTESAYPVNEFLRDQVDDYVENDVEIPFRIDTGNLTLSKQFENMCYPQKLVIEMERGSGIQAYVGLDNDPFYQLQGEAVKGCTILDITARDQMQTTPVRCRQINISLRDTTNKLCKITRIAVLYADTPETEDYQKIEMYE